MDDRCYRSAPSKASSMDTESRDTKGTRAYKAPAGPWVPHNEGIPEREDS